MSQVAYNSIADYDLTVKGHKSSLWKTCRSFSKGVSLLLSVRGMTREKE